MFVEEFYCLRFVAFGVSGVVGCFVVFFYSFRVFLDRFRFRYCGFRVRFLRLGFYFEVVRGDVRG